MEFEIPLTLKVPAIDAERATHHVACLIESAYNYNGMQLTVAGEPRPVLAPVEPALEVVA